METFIRTLPPVLCGLVLQASLPGSATAQDVQELEVVEVWSTEGIEIADGLTAVVGLVEAGDGSIWMTDMWPLEGRVLVLDPESMRAEVVGRKGDGPGEVLLPNDLAVLPDGRIAVYDVLRRAIEVYDPDGEPFRRVQLRGATIQGAQGFAALATGGFVLTGVARPSQSAVHYFDSDGEWVRGWRDPYPPRDAFPANESEVAIMMAQGAGTGGHVHALPDGSFLHAPHAPHEIVLFERSSTQGNGWTERTLVSTPELFEPPGATIVETSNEGGQPSWSFRDAWPHSMYVFGLADGYILNVVDMGEEERWLWQVFDPQRGPDGEAALVAQASLDRRYILNHLCENGDILAAIVDLDTGVSHAVRLRLEGPWASRGPER